MALDHEPLKEDCELCLEWLAILPAYTPAQRALLGLAVTEGSSQLAQGHKERVVKTVIATLELLEVIAKNRPRSGLDA